VVVALVDTGVDVGVVVLDIVEVETVVDGERALTTMNLDFVLSQVAHASGFEGSNSNRPTPVLQQLTVPSQQKDVSLPVTLPQDIISGPIFGAAF
jgi:hypothetical protein